MSALVKPFLDILDPQVTPCPPTGRKKLDAIRAIYTGLSGYDPVLSTYDPLRASQALHELMSLNGFQILKPYLRDDDAEVVSEAVLILSEAARDSRYDAIVLSGGIREEFTNLLEHPSLAVRGLAVWGLVRIGLDSLVSRDLLRHGIVGKLCEAFDRTDNMGFRKNVVNAITSLRSKLRPDDEYLTPICKTLRKVLSSPTTDEEFRGKKTRSSWLSDVVWTVLYLTTGDSRDVQRCLDHDLPQLALKLLRTEIAVAPKFRGAGLVRRSVASEHLGEVMSYLPRTDLVRVCTLSRDVFNASVCDHKVLYGRLRSSCVFASDGGLCCSAVRMVCYVLCGGKAQATVALAHGAAEVLESLAVLPDLQTFEKQNLLRALSKLAEGPEEHARVVTSSDVFLDAIGSTFYSNDSYKLPLRCASDALCNLWARTGGDCKSLSSECPNFIVKVLLPAIAACLSSHPCLTTDDNNNDGPLSDVFRILEAEIKPERKAAIEQRMRVLKMSKRKQQEKVSIVRMLYVGRSAVRRRQTRTIEEIAGGLRRYLSYLQEGWSAAGQVLGVDEVVLCLYQEVSHAISSKNQKRAREE